MLEENTVSAGGEALLDDSKRQDMGEWFDMEAHPLGQCFVMERLEESRLKELLIDLNLNFGVHGKQEKKGKTQVGCQAVGEEIFNHES